MTHEIYWENGERVPAYDPREKDSCEKSIESDALIMMRRLLGFLKASPHPDLTIDCLCLISSLCYEGKSMAEIAREHKVSRATVSRRCVDLCDSFGIEPTRAMRSRKGRENCRNARFKNVENTIK
jgi:hypothetical protein